MKNPRINIASFIFVIAIAVAITLVTIMLRNPATHANLEDPEFYDRTELAVLGVEYDYLGYGSAEAAVRAGASPYEIGRALYVRAGCIGCHGVFAQGATVADTLWDLDEEELGDVVRDIRDGPPGMPAYPEHILEGDDIDLILAYISQAPANAAAAGVTTTTTTTTTLPPPVTTTTTVTAATTTTAGDGVTVTSGPQETTTTTAPPAPTRRTIEAPRVEAITVDGDPADWSGIAPISMTLEPTIGESAPPHEATVRVAHDGTYIYVLFTVEDDFNWSQIDPRFAGAPAVMWPIDAAAGPHMGGDDETGLPALGMVDIWYWRLECPIGVEQGGSVGGPGSGDPGNDDACNLDDEWASEPENVEDDDGDGAENSLLGMFSHTNPTNDELGTWFFEFRRPLQTGDALDAQFTPGTTAQIALAYWDPDAGQSGWGRRDHVQSSNEGWIDVVLAE